MEKKQKQEQNRCFLCIVLQSCHFLERRVWLTCFSVCFVRAIPLAKNGDRILKLFQHRGPERP